MIIDVQSNEVVVEGLSMPHSPRWHDKRLWVLESGKGELCMVDLERAAPRPRRAARLHARDVASGRDRVRRPVADPGVPTFGDLPLIAPADERQCGVWVVDLQRGEIEGFLRFDDLVQEVFDVAPAHRPPLPGDRRARQLRGRDRLRAALAFRLSSAAVGQGSCRRRGLRRFDDLGQEVFDVALLTGKRHPEIAARARDLRVLAWAGGAFALVIAVALDTGFSIDGNLWRDETIFAYGGQQLLKGVPVYSSIFDLKMPLGTILCGLGALVGGWFGLLYVHGMRVEFFAFACLTVVAVDFFALRLWNSPLAGVVSATIFASFRGFAGDALGGPDAKTPGIFFAVLSMALLVRRKWFGRVCRIARVPRVAAAHRLPRHSDRLGGGVVGCRRPAQIRGARVGRRSRSDRRDALLLPGRGALPRFFETAVNFPLTGVQRGKETLEHGSAASSRWRTFITGAPASSSGAASSSAPPGRRGTASRTRLKEVLLDPYVCAVITTFLGIAIFSLTDFQGYPDLFPLSPTRRSGGGATAFLERHLKGVRLQRGLVVLALLAVAVVIGRSWVVDPNHHEKSLQLGAERAYGAKLQGAWPRRHPVRARRPDAARAHEAAQPEPLHLPRLRGVPVGGSTTRTTASRGGRKHHGRQSRGGHDRRLERADQARAPGVAEDHLRQGHPLRALAPVREAAHPRSRCEHGDHSVGSVPTAVVGQAQDVARSATAAGCGTLSRPPIRLADSRSGARSMAARSDG